MKQLQSGLGAELAKFPPKLRKLALHIIDSDDFKSTKTYCKEAGVKYDSARTLIAQQRKKGRDFHMLLREYYSQMLHRHKPAILKALVKGAKKGSIAHIRTVLQLTGDIKADGTAAQTTHNTQNNQYFILGPSSVPELQAKSEEVKSMQPLGPVIDAEVVDKETNG